MNITRFLFLLAPLVYSCTSIASILTVYSGYRTDAAQFNLASSESEASHVLTSGTYETLLVWDGGTNFKPWLAKSWKKTDDLTIQFDLHKNIVFHNGQIMTPADVIGSLKFLKKNTRFNSLMLSNIDNATQIGQSIVQFRLQRPDPLALRKISFWLRILPCSQACERSQNIAGTGRWIPEFNHGRIQRFLPHQKYWQTTPSSSNFSELRISQITDQKFENFDTTNEQSIMVYDLPWTKMLWAKRSGIFNTESFLAGIAVFGVFNLKSQNKLLFSEKFRHAINLAINRKELRKLVFGNRALSLRSLSISTDEGYNKEVLPYDYNPQKAKDILKSELSAANINRFELTIGLQSGDPTTKRMGKFICSSLDAVGVHCTILETYDVDQHDQLKGRVDLVLGNDPSPYGHSDFFLENFFSAQSPYFLNSDPVISDLMKQAKEASSEQSASILYKKIDQEFRDRHFGVPGFQFEKLIAYSKNIRYVREPSGILNLSNIYMNSALFKMP